jgi:putative redox protein
LRLYANRKQWPLEDIRVSLSRKQELSESGEKTELFHRVIELFGHELTAEQRQRLLDIANKCPVHKILVGKIEIETELLTQI